MEQRIVEIDGARISYYDNEGEGAPLVFCHGNSSSAKAFERLIHSLGSGVRAFALDFVGHGDSSSPELGGIPCTLRGYAALLPRFVVALGLRTCTLVGHSLGGHAVLESLPLLGGIAKKAICISAPPFNHAMLARVFRDPTEGLIFKSALTRQEAERVACAFVAKDRVSPSILQEVVETILSTADGSRSSIGAGVASGDFADEVAICRGTDCPLVFVQGTDDRFIVADYYRELELRAGVDEVCLIERVLHCPHLEAPELVREIVMRHAAV